MAYTAAQMAVDMGTMYRGASLINYGMDDAHNSAQVGARAWGLRVAQGGKFEAPEPGLRLTNQNVSHPNIDAQSSQLHTCTPCPSTPTPCELRTHYLIWPTCTLSAPHVLSVFCAQFLHQGQCDRSCKAHASSQNQPR